MHLVGFTIEIYYDARPYERQRWANISFFKRAWLDKVVSSHLGQTGEYNECIWKRIRLEYDFCSYGKLTKLRAIQLSIPQDILR